MFVTEYDVGPGAYGVVVAADGTTWASLVERGELACVSPDGQVSRVRLGAGQSRPMVLTRGPDGAVWFSRGDGRIGRIDPAGTVSSVPVATSAAPPYGLCAGPDRSLWYTLLAADRIGRISLDGGTAEFPLAAGSMPALITAGPDGALWCTLNQAGAVARITPDGFITTYPLPTADAAPVGIDAGREVVWFAEIGAGQIGRIRPDGRIEEFPLPDRSCRPHAVAAAADGAAGPRCGPPVPSSGWTATAAWSSRLASSLALSPTESRSLPTGRSGSRSNLAPSHT